MNHTELLRQALDALERCTQYSDGGLPVYPSDAKRHRLILALREALAQPAPEHVGWGLLKPDGTVDHDLVGTLKDCQYWAEAVNERQSGWIPVPLYAALPAVPAPAVREPLTDEQLAEITVNIYGSAIHATDHDFARAIEQAHGITGAGK